jgi:succinate dehydrogenase/fumarate reductase flavoprotein subunit
VVLATGGIGRAFKVTSNSWEYTGDGHALAYHAGAELKDMEFVQFHPTGMVWPISVRGILVTEGVRGARPNCLPAIKWRAASIAKSRPAAARRLSVFFLDIAWLDSRYCVH